MIRNRPDFLVSILESTYAGIITCDAAGVIAYVNNRAHEIAGHNIPTGTTVEEWLKKSPLFYIDRMEPLSLSDAPLLRALNNKEVVRGFEARFERSDRSMGTVTLSANPLFDQDKNHIGAMVSFVDITETRRKNEELSTQNKRLQESVIERTSILQDMNIALGRSQTRFRTIVEQSPFGIQIFNNKGKTILLNPAWKKIFNLPEEFIQNFIMKDYNVLQDPLLEKNGVAHLVKRAFAGETVTVPEIYYNPRYNGHDYEGKWIESIMYPLKQVGGEVREIVLIHNDVTERHETREQKSRFIETQNFLSSVTDLLLTTIDFEDIIERVAQSSIPFFCDGAIVDLIEGETIKRIIARHHVPETQLAMKEMQNLYIPTMESSQPSSRVIRSGEPELLKHVDHRIISERTMNTKHADLIKRINIRSHIAVPLINRGKVIGALNFLITTERRHFDDQDLAISVELARRAALAINNARLYRDAKAAIQQRDDFISIASHELKTPITSLKLQQEVIVKALDSFHDKNGDIEFVMKAAQNSNKQLDRLTRLVEDMLDISRISTGKLAMNLKQVDFSHLLKEVLERFGHQLKTLKIKLILGELKPVMITCDPYRIEQVLTNIMTNAIRYGEKKPITITMDQADGYVFYRIRDQGLGIAKEDQERIFNRFERAISFDTISGLGLGLFISRQIVQDHGGELSVESKPAMGSTFTIKLRLG